MASNLLQLQASRVHLLKAERRPEVSTQRERRRWPLLQAREANLELSWQEAPRQL